MREELQEFADIMLGAMDRMENHLLERMDVRFNVVDDRFDRVENRLESVHGRVTSLEMSVRKIEGVVADIRDDLKAGLRAIDKDAEMLLDHQARIGVLEKGHKKLLLKLG